MEWDNTVTIGYSAGGDPYDNYDPSTSEIACLNTPYSNITNVIYRLSDADPEIPPPGIILTKQTKSIVIVPFKFFQNSLTLELC